MKKKSLAVNATLNTVRQALSVIFPLLTFPYVSRTLGTTEFGRYQFAVSIVSYFSLFAAYGISNYGIREGARIRNKQEEINSLVSRLFSFNLITTTISYIGLVVLIIFSSKIHDYWILILIQSSCMIMTTIGMDWVNNIYEDFLYITIRYIVVQLVALMSIFLFVHDSGDTAKYCLIVVIGSYGGNLINLFYIRRYVKVRPQCDEGLKSFLLPLSLLFINSIAVIIYVNSDITMLGLLKTDDEVGVYSFSSKIYNILKHMINAAVVVVVPRLATQVKSDFEKYRRLLSRVFSALMLILFPIAAALFCLSQEIIQIAGGNEYISGSWALKILSFSLIFALFSSVYTNCMLILNRHEKKCIVATSSSAAINVALNFILIPYLGIVGAAMTTVIAELVNLIIQSYYGKKLVCSDRLLNVKDLFSSLLGAFIVIIVCAIIRQTITETTTVYCLLKIVIAMLATGALYLGTLVVLKNDLVMHLLKYRIY